ncbi:MAG: hypothetical protein ACLRTA_07520 [Clostridia bacterium]|nr:hypothetical protein [Clostridia bacterium]
MQEKPQSGLCRNGRNAQSVLCRNGRNAQSEACRIEDKGED